jgi:sigma-E factor negative regulatory protein RseA
LIHPNREDGTARRQEQDMTQELSSLMDGELEGHEAQRAIEACCASDDAKAKWHLYHVIGDAMRGHAPRELAPPHATLEKLVSQPTVLAPPRVHRPHVTFTRVALAAAASVATVGVVGWIGSQGGQGSAVPVTAKASSGIQPVANTVSVPQAAPAADVQPYLNAHRQVPTPEQYRPAATHRAPATAAR